MVQNLLIEVSKVSGIEIHTRGDCELLSALILEETDQLVSYNTLRRLFGLAPSSKPRKQTLDILAKFCGYSGYQNFCIAQPKLSLWKQREALYQLLAHRDVPAIAFFLNAIENDLFKLELLVTAFRELLLTNQDEIIIELLGAGVYELDRHPYTYQIHAAIAMGLIIREQPIARRKNLLSDPQMIDCVYLRLIDYSALNGYYGDWTELLAGQSTSRATSLECQVFVDCLRRFIAFLNQSTLEPWTWTELPWQELHPALKGRIFTAQLLDEVDESFDSLWREIFAVTTENLDPLSAFIEPSTFAIATGNPKLASWLIQKIKINESTLQQFQMHDLHVHFLMQAMSALFQKRSKDARFWMSRFDKNELRSPCFHDFLTFSIRRIETELDGSAHVYPEEVRQVVSKLGHPWFSEDLWHSFFN